MAQGEGYSQEHSRNKDQAQAGPITCENVTYKEALDHRGQKGTAEEDIRLGVLFLSSAGYNNLAKLLPKKLDLEHCTTNKQEHQK